MVKDDCSGETETSSKGTWNWASGTEKASTGGPTEDIIVECITKICATDMVDSFIPITTALKAIM